MQCDLSIALDRGATYRPGEPIEGTLRVQTSGLVRCDALKIATVYHTHGKGNRAVGAIEEVELFQGDWAAGTSDYRFRLHAPSAPVPYHGEILNVELGIRATADIPWAVDPSTLVPIEVHHEPKSRGYEVTWDKKEERDQWGFGCAVLAAVMLGVAALLLAIAFAAGSDSPLYGFGATAGVFGLIGLLVAIPRWMAERRVGNIRFLLEQAGGASYREASSEGFLDVGVIMAANAAPSEVRVDLGVEEVVVKGSGTNKRTFRHGLYEASIALERGAEPGRFRGRLALPRPGTVAGTFKAPSNSIVWKVACRVDIPSWPDWKDEVVLDVKAV